MLLTKTKKTEPQTESIELKLPAYFKLYFGMAMICENGNIIKVNKNLLLEVEKDSMFYQEKVDELLNCAEIDAAQFYEYYSGVLFAIQNNFDHANL